MSARPRKTSPKQTYLFGEAVPAVDDGDLIFDYFAGGGGVSRGIERALGRSPHIAINHCAHAIAMHTVNHPATDHLQVNVWDVDPKRHLPPGNVALAWFSPDCTHFSRAKGSKPVSRRVRGLAWVACRVAGKRRPRVIILENVQEFRTWGPVRDGRPVAAKAGQHYRKFLRQLRVLGYVVEDRVLDAADYGAPTHRRRLILVARCDGTPISWPEPTHGPGRAHPYRTAAECIDWTIPVPSIFGRKRPLAEATQRRIAEGLRRFVIEAERPYIVQTSRGPATPTLVQTGYGERPGQAPRALDLHQPLGTIVACGAKHAVVMAWIAKHYGGVVGHGLERALGTITTRDHHSLVEATFAPAGEAGERARDVAAFVIKYYGQGTGQPVSEPLHTIVTKARFGLVTVTIGGEPYTIVDIGLRMLTPRELARAQGFDDTYMLSGTQAQQIERIGNSVPPPLAEAVVRANVRTTWSGAEAAE